MLQIKINKQVLLKMLNVATEAIPSKTTEASFLNVLFTVSSAGLTIFASDGNISIKVDQDKTDENGNVVISENKDGKIQIPAKLFRDIVTKLSLDYVTIEEMDSSFIRVSDNKTEFMINCKPGIEYPDIEFYNSNGTEISIDRKQFDTLYQSTYFSVAIKNSRQMFLGINIKCSDNKLSFTASDACRLARKTIEISNDALFAFNCPSKVLAIVDRLDSSELIKINLGADRVTFNIGNITVGAKTIPGGFPDADRIIPSSYPCTLEIAADEFMETLDRVCTVSFDDKVTSKTARLTFDGEKLTISSRSQVTGNAKEEPVNYKFTGEKFTINFNSEFARQACRAIQEEKITIKFSGENKMFRVCGTDDSNLQLITPIRYYGA